MKIEFDSTAEELKFHKQILDTFPISVIVLQVEDIKDPLSFSYVWSNQKFHEYTGLTEDEISGMGYDFFMKIFHPGDFDIIFKALKKLKQDMTDVYGGLMRLRNTEKSYHWFLGSISVMDKKANKPWRINIILGETNGLEDLNKQLFQIYKDNSAISNDERINSLTMREKDIVKLIAGGPTDNAIADELHISQSTVKTHRHNIIQKLGVNNKAAIAQFATENGLD